MSTYGETLARSVDARIAASPATQAALAAIPLAQRQDGQFAIVEADQTAWQFVLGSSAPAGVGVAVPTDGLGGRWLAVVPASVGGIVLYAIAPVDAIAVTNQATMTGLAQTIDGVALNTAGMRVYLAKQTTAAQNGLWVVQAGAWTRPTDWATGATPPTGTRIRVKPGGTTNYPKYGSEWFVYSVSGVIDTGTIISYPVVVRGQGALNGASPSVLAVATAWVLSATTSVPAASNMTTATNGVKSVLSADSVAGAGDGTLTVTGPNAATDTIGWSFRNA